MVLILILLILKNVSLTGNYFMGVGFNIWCKLVKNPILKTNISGISNIYDLNLEHNKILITVIFNAELIFKLILMPVCCRLLNSNTHNELPLLELSRIFIMLLQ